MPTQFRVLVEETPTALMFTVQPIDVFRCLPDAGLRLFDNSFKVVHFVAQRWKFEALAIGWVSDV